MEAEEGEKWKQLRNNKIALQEAQMLQKHKKEREAHENRVKTALDELNIERNKEIQRLYQNFHNTKNQMANVQKIEITQLSNPKMTSPLKVGLSSQASGNVKHQEGPPSIPSANGDD